MWRNYISTCTNWNNILIPFVFFSGSCKNSLISYLCRFMCSIYTETEKSSFWWNVHHWLHWKLSKWQLPVQPVMKMSSKWRHLCFSVCVTPCNRGVNIAPRIGVANPVSRDSPPGGCYGDRKIWFYYVVLILLCGFCNLTQWFPKLCSLHNFCRRGGFKPKP